MSVDCSDWVWTQSASKGIARTVLLAIADKCRDERCVAYAGTAMLMQRTNAVRSSVRRAVDALLASGELAIVEGAQGPGGETVYQLPHAIGHTRQSPHGPMVEGTEDQPGGPDFGPGSESAPGPVTTPPGAGIDSPGGPKIGPGEGRESAPGGSGSVRGEGRGSAPGGPDFGPHNNSSLLEEQQPHAPARTGRPPVTDQLRPLVDALTTAGVEVRWTLGLGEQRDAWQLVQRHGVERLVELATHRTAPGDAPKSARYWLKVWGDLDHSPAQPPAGPAVGAGGNVVPLRGGRPAPTSSADALRAGLALLEQEENA